MRRPTSVDVAHRAGVSQSTVSLVLSGKGAGRVSAATEATVRAAALELGYRPNFAARALKTGAGRTVALVVRDVRQPFFSGVLRGAQGAARAAGYAVGLVDAANDPEWGTDAAQALGAGPADGLLLFAVEPPGAGAPAVPIVLIDSGRRGYSGVRLDVEAGVQAVARHLAELGHTRVGHLTSAHEGATFRRRRRPLRAVLGDTPRAKSDFTPEDARDAALGLLRDHPELTAVLCDDDVLGAGVYLACRVLGLRIPQDLSVVGFDDLALSRILDPPLTTVRADPELLGRTAFELFEEAIAGRRPRTVVQEVELLVRESAAAPRR
jgi:DNA-binding LacI/PurR family transcriptional regulator